MNVIIDNLDLFVSGFWLTFQLCVLAGVGALILGTIAAVLRISPVPPLRLVGTSYVNLFRNVPLFIITYGEAMRTANLLAENPQMRNPLQVYTVVGIIFITVNYSLSKLAVYTQRRIARGRRGTPAAQEEPPTAEAATVLPVPTAR